jgi:hypothetical protein
MKLEFPLEKKFPLGSGFGPRGALAGGRIKAHNHKGQDIAAPTGTKVKSVDDGVVVRSTPPGQSGGYGNFIVVKHKDFYSAYGHLSKREVNKGDTVKKGQLIGLVGSTGQSTGPHLHFEIRKTENGSQIDPKPYLTGSELSSTILGKETDDEKPDDKNDDKKTVDPVDPVDPEEPEDYGIMGQLLKMVGFKENYTIEGQHNIMEDINRIKQLLK